jgi:sirohydrochlorin cobaltochelatase
LFGGGTPRKTPEAIEDFQRRNPQLAVTLSPPVGPDRRILEILKERLTSAIQSAPSPDTAVLLVARGFSDQDAMAEMEEVRVRFTQETGLRTVRRAFVEIASPSIAEGIQACLTLKLKKSWSFPIFFFRA